VPTKRSFPRAGDSAELHLLSRALCAVPAACCVDGILLCLHSASNQGHESVGAKFVAEKLISLAPSHNGFRSPFERFAAIGAHTVCGGWMRLTDHALFSLQRKTNISGEIKVDSGLCDSQDQKMGSTPINASSRNLIPAHLPLIISLLGGVPADGRTL